MGHAVCDGGVDGDLGHIAQNTEVVVVLVVLGQLTTSHFHGMRGLDGTLPVLTDTAHGLGVGREHGDTAQIMQHVFSSNRFRTDTAFSKSSVRRDSRVQVVAHADHVKQLGLGVHTKGQAGVGRRRQHVHEAGCTNDVRCVTTAATFRVECVDGTAFKRSDGVFHIARLIQRVGVDGHLHIVLVGNAQAGTNGVGCSTPVFVDLECAHASFELLNQRRFASTLVCSSLTFAHQAHVQRHSLLRTQHLLNVEHARCYGRSVGTVSRTKTTSNQRCTATSQCGVVNLRADRVHVGVDTPSGHDGGAAVDGVGSGTASHARRNTSHGVGVTSLADTHNLAVLDADVGLDHALHCVNDGGVGQHQIQTACAAGCGVVETHTVTQRFTTAEHGLIAVAGTQIFFNFNKQIGVTEANLVADCGTIEAHILFTRNLSHNAFLSNTKGFH